MAEGAFRRLLVICARRRNELIFARQREIVLGTFSTKTGVLLRKTPAFCDDGELLVPASAGFFAFWRQKNGGFQWRVLELFFYLGQEKTGIPALGDGGFNT